MTVYGTIFGHDKKNDVTAVRKFGAFAATTWLRQAKAITETGAASTEPDFGLNGKTLKVVISQDGKCLHHMVVQVDDMISAIYYVKEKTLLAAQMEKEKFTGETDEISAMFLDLQVRNRIDGGATKAANSTKARATTATNAKTEGDENALVSEQSEPETVEHESSSAKDDDAASSPSSPNSELSKIRILEIRAEAMAEAFREDVCGPNFKMPAEFR